MKRFALGWIVSIGWCGAAVSAAAAADAVDYLRDIKPLLTARCYDCHAGDTVEAELRLDTARTAIEGGNTGPAIVAGKANESLLIRRITATKAQDRMPPEDSGEPLSAAEIALLSAWIEQGAAAPADEQPVLRKSRPLHWSFQSIARPTPPAVSNSAWVRTPIDAFILAALEAHHIAPAPEADRVTLLRRASLDLVGLPPTDAELTEYLADTGPDAYERWVDRLLASPHYGERWGRHWLDQARYADSDGYTNDTPRTIWKYRDWVIAAFNRDLPFDQFVIDQLAGDLRPQATQEQIIATGFHRNTQHNREGGSDEEQYRVERIADRVNTTGTVFLGLTIGCARCHDHKFDDLTQREFYQFFAFFDGCDEPTYPVASSDEQAKLDAMRAEIAAAEQDLKQHEAGMAALQPAWEADLLSAASIDWTVLDPKVFTSGNAADLTKLPDGSVRAGGVIPNGDTYNVTAPAPVESITAIRLEALVDDVLPNRGPGVTDKGDFTLHEFALAATPPGGKSTPAPLDYAWADYSTPKFDIALAIDGNQATGWGILVPEKEVDTNVDRTAVFFLKQPLASPTDTQLHVRLEHIPVGSVRVQVGRFRLAVTSADPQLLRRNLNQKLREVLALPPAERNPQQQQLAAAEFQKTEAGRVQRLARISSLKQQEQQFLRSIPTTLIVKELPKPRVTRVHLRGNFLTTGREVRPNVPASLPSIAPGAERPSRLDLANWLVDPRNPLTARVTVNRIWQAYFGRGIVETDNDFGRQGLPPSHPELLDWLASELVRCGWSQKALHRLIVTSAVYRQASAIRADLNETDPRNIWLGRQARLRLEAEVIRDAALRTSGLLSAKLGGPGVFPPQPDGVMYLARDPGRKWTVSPGEDRYRRGVYTYFWRSTPYPFLKTFDAPDSNTTCTRRDRSNTPLQALMLLNDEAFFEAAQGLAARVLAANLPSDSDRLRWVFRLCLLREPGEAEVSALNELLAGERQDATSAAPPMKTPALERLPAGIDPREVTAWTAVSRALLNLDEFITRE